MSFTSDSKEQISLKKLVGKAHTKNEAEFYNESKKSGITINANTVFAEDLPSNPGSGSQYQVTSSIVEYIRLPLTPLQESVQNGRYHAFSAALPSTYESNANNQNKGNGIFDSNTEIHASLGKIQLVPNTFGDVYEVKVFKGGDAETLGDGTNIPVLDDRKWYFDYFNGILFQQNPPDNPNPPTTANGDDDHLTNNPNNPSYIEAYVYIGKMASERFTESNGGGNGSNGNDGEDGADFTFKGTKLTKSALDAVSNPEKGDAYFVDVDEDQSNLENVIYVYDGASFVSGGSFKGDEGPQGNAGADGAPGTDGADGATISSVSISGTTITTTLSDTSNVSGNISLSIDNLSDVDITTETPESDEILKWNGTNFIPSPDTGKTEEEIEDIVGAMITGGTETDISVTYNDTDGLINFVVDKASILNDASLTGTPTATDPVAGDNTTSIATTAFVQGELSSYQPLDAALTSISGLTTSANQIIYTTASDAYAVSTLTSFARDLLDDVSAEAMRNTLGLGSASLSDSNAFLSASAVIDNLSDVSITSIQNAQILVYDDDSGEADDKWKNVSISGDITISNTGVATITSGSISNEMITNSFIDITAGGSTDRLNLGETFTIAGVNNQIEVSNTIDAAGETEGSTLTIGLPDDVTIAGDLTVSGDLTINGDATSIVTTNLDVTDSVISLNNGIIGNDPVNNPVANPSTRDIGFFFDRGSLDPALIFWDEADDVFKLGTNSGNINSTASDLGDANFAYSVLKIASPKDAQDNLDLTSNDNTAATTEWTASKISAIEINDLSDVDTTGVAEGKILKFDENNQLVIAEPNGFVADTASLWAIDPNDSNNIFPHGIIDGTLDTGLFAINLSASDVNLASNNTTLEDIVAAIQNINAYTYTTRTDAEDTYWEFVDPDNDNYDIQPKDY